MDLFEETFGLKLDRCRPARWPTGCWRRRVDGGLRGTPPHRLCRRPRRRERAARVPVGSKGPEPKDFLGNEFLMWLWHEADTGSGVVETAEAAR